MDELLTYLHSTAPENIIIGDNDCNLLILGDSSTRPTTIKALLFVIGCASDISKETVNELRKMYSSLITFRLLYRHGSQLAQLAKIPFIMVAYKKCDLDEIDNINLESMSFCVKKEYPGKDKFQILDSPSFITYLYKIMDMKYYDAGTHKPKNKSLADVFHLWSRAKLSSHVIKQDLDAIYHNNNEYSMIEIKRSPTRTLDQWAPYKEDSSNYDIQNQFAKATNASFFTFHHNGGECTDETKVGCYKILNVNLSNSANWIDYEKAIIKAKEILKTLNT